MAWLLIHYNKSHIDKVIVIKGNWKKLQQYIINNVEQLYQPFFNDIIKNEHYDVNSNKLCRYVYQYYNYRSGLEQDEVIPLIEEFYTKFPKKIKSTLKYYGGTNENDKYPIIQLLKCDDVTIVQ